MAVLPLTNAILVGLEADNPTGNPWITIDKTKAEEAFNEALLALPSQGGTLYVLPMNATTTAYEFKNPVNVSKPNVTIEFLGGSELTLPVSGSAPTNMFYVTGNGFRCIGARVKHTINPNNNFEERSLFRVEADDAQFLDCSFDVKQDVSGNTVIRSFSCIRLFANLAPGEDPFRKNLKVGRCTFVLQPGTGQDLPWLTPPTGLTEPRGVCCIRATGLRGCILTENHFRSGSATAKGDCGPVVYLLDVEECTVSINTIRGLKTPPSGAAPDRGTLVRLRHQFSEGHHTIVSCNVFEDLETSHVLVLENVQFDYVTGNIFDLIGPNCFSVIHATGGSVLGIVGNAITRLFFTTTVEGAVFLQAVHNVTLSANIFSDLPAGMKPIEIASGGGNIQVSPYQARTVAP